MVCLCHKTEIHPDKFFELSDIMLLSLSSDLSCGYKANICILTHFYSYFTGLLWPRIQPPEYWYKINKLLESCKHFISVLSEPLNSANSATFLCTAQVTPAALDHQNRWHILECAYQKQQNAILTMLIYFIHYIIILFFWAKINIYV